MRQKARNLFGLRGAFVMGVRGHANFERQMGLKLFNLPSANEVNPISPCRISGDEFFQIKVSRRQIDRT